MAATDAKDGEVGFVTASADGVTLTDADRYRITFGMPELGGAFVRQVDTVEPFRDYMVSGDIFRMAHKYGALRTVDDLFMTQEFDKANR